MWPCFRVHEGSQSFMLWKIGSSFIQHNRVHSSFPKPVTTFSLFFYVTLSTSKLDICSPTRRPSSFQQPRQFPSQSRQYPRLRQINRIHRQPQLPCHFRRRPIQHGCLPTSLPRCRLELSRLARPPASPIAADTPLPPIPSTHPHPPWWGEQIQIFPGCATFCRRRLRQLIP